MNKREAYLTAICSLVIVASAGCTTTWDLYKQLGTSAKEVSLEDMALIELEPQPDLVGFRIAHIKHRDLGIEKGKAGFRDTQSSISSIYLPPGNVRLRTKRVGHKKPQVEFFAEPGGKYLLSSVCVPTRYTPINRHFMAILDADSRHILAVDDFCPDCKALIGSHESNWQCTDQQLVKKGFELVADCKYMDGLPDLRLICDAAQRGIPSAMAGLGRFYKTRDYEQSYYWYSMAAQQEIDDYFIFVGRSWSLKMKNKLTLGEVAQVRVWLLKEKPRNCEKHLFEMFDCN